MNRKYRVFFLFLLWVPFCGLSSQQVLNGYDGYWKDPVVLTAFDLLAFEPEELGFLRNEIFARYGRAFKTEKYQAYFNGKAWYRPNPDYKDSLLTEQDRKNANLILTVERPQLSEDDMRRRILDNMEYTGSQGTVLTFLGGADVSIMELSEGVSVYMGRSRAQDKKWKILGDWVIVYDPGEPDEEFSAYVLNHNARGIAQIARNTMPRRDAERVIENLELRR